MEIFIINQVLNNNFFLKIEFIFLLCLEFSNINSKILGLFAGNSTYTNVERLTDSILLTGVNTRLFPSNPKNPFMRLDFGEQIILYGVIIDVKISDTSLDFRNIFISVNNDPGTIYAGSLNFCLRDYSNTASSGVRTYALVCDSRYIGNHVLLQMHHPPFDRSRYELKLLNLYIYGKIYESYEYSSKI